MMYHYFVSYAVMKNPEGIDTIGQEEICRNSIVSSMEDVLSLREDLAKKIGVKLSYLSIIWYDLICDEPY